MKMYDIPEGKRATRGKSIMNFLALAVEERVTSVLVLPRDKSGSPSLLLVTKFGSAKRVASESLRDVRRSGIIAITLDAGDELLSATATAKDDEAVIVTAAGQGIRFRVKDIRQMGRAAGGVRAIRLKKGDVVVGLGQVTRQTKTGELLVVAANGFGKRTKLSEYKTQRRGGSGVKTAKVTAKTGRLIVGLVLEPETNEVVAISKQGQVIRTKLEEISVLGRATQGVRIMKVRPGDALASLTCL